MPDSQWTLRVALGLLVTVIASGALAQIVDRYPDSNEAKTAKGLLRKIG